MGVWATDLWISASENIQRIRDAELQDQVFPFHADALMRANGIPAGFCYQRLSVNGDGPPYCLHGLNAVFLKAHSWYRIDARGNTDSIRAAFSPPHEKLAFSVADTGEADLPEIWPVPLPIVVAALSTAQSVEELQHNLPDIPVIKSPR